MSDTDKVLVIFYFISGDFVEICFDKKTWKNTHDFLRKEGFADNAIIDNNYGINYNYVTHFIVKDK